jgi:cytochrome c oxidase cbb3-type subunit 3
MRFVIVAAALLCSAASLISASRELPEPAGPTYQAAQNPVGPIPGGGAPPVQPSNPYRGDAEAAQQGRRLFVTMNCSGCHGGRAGGGMGPSLRDTDWIYGNSDADIFSSIAQGRAHGMPAWGTRLPLDSIWMLVAYVVSLRTPGEPDAPR